MVVATEVENPNQCQKSVDKVICLAKEQLTSLSSNSFLVGGVLKTSSRTGQSSKICMVKCTLWQVIQLLEWIEAKQTGPSNIPKVELESLKKLREVVTGKRKGRYTKLSFCQL